MARKATDTASGDDCLADVQAGKPQPVYLFDGDGFLADREARRLAEAFIAEKERSLNLVELDAGASPSDVAAELATGGLFGGRKAVVVHDPAFLIGKESAEEAFERARQMWKDGRQREAARRLLALAAKAGWGARELDAGADGAPTASDWREELGIGLEAGDRELLAEVSRYALERDMKAAKDDAGALDGLLAKGLPPGHMLIVAAHKVDGRLPLVKKLAAAGRRVTVGVPVEGQWNDKRIVLGPLLDELLAGSGKKVDRGGQERLAELVGDDARALAKEVEKLAAYVGDRKTIGRAEVDALVTRTASDPFFALGNAVEAKDLTGALGILQRAFTDGDSPFMVLGALAGTVRRLIVEKERARVAANRPLRSYDEWQALVLPSVDAEELEGKKPYGLWMKYQASARFPREKLLDALADLADADVGMKSGGNGETLLERAVIRLLGEAK